MPQPFRSQEARSVRAFTERLGLPGLIDVHTHFMPKQVLDKVWAYFDSVGPILGREWPITYRAQEDERVATLCARSVSWSYSSMIYPTNRAWRSGSTAGRSTSPPRIRTAYQTATFYPEPRAREYVADAIAAGARIFKSHIQVGDYSPRRPASTRCGEQIDAAQIPVVIHCGSGPAPGAHTGGNRYAACWGQFPLSVDRRAHGNPGIRGLPGTGRTV